MEANGASKGNGSLPDEVNGNDKALATIEDSNSNSGSNSISDAPVNGLPVKGKQVVKDHMGSVRGRTLSEGSNSEEDDKKKQKIGATSQSMGFLVPGIAASPPKFLSLEQIMKAAKAVSNLSLAHEIVVNKDFKLETAKLEDDSFHRQIKDIVHKAFWDVLQAQLDEDPPVYTNALNLLSEIKEGLLSLLLPHHTKLHLEINEVLDLDLIKQQAENGVLAFHYYAQYIISVMSKMCAPVRDEEIQELMRVHEIVPLFRGIFKTLDMMKLDMANFHIQLIRPQLQEQTIEYEKKKFAEYLTIHDDGMEFTRAWLQRSLSRLEKKRLEDDIKGASSNLSSVSAVNILTEAFMELLQWNDTNSYPETLLMDQTRFMELCKRVDFISLAAAILLVTYSTVGPAISGISHFKEQLKSHLTVLLDGMETNDLTEIMKNVAEQVTKEVNECLVKHGYQKLSTEKEGILKGQIEEVADTDHKIRQLVKTRVLEFVELCLSSLTASPVRIPPGLSSMQVELSHLTGQFLRLVSHNRGVFSEYYGEIINTIRKSNNMDGVVNGDVTGESPDGPSH